MGVSSSPTYSWRASAASTGRDPDALKAELSKLLLVAVGVDLQDQKTQAKSKETTLKCFRVGAKAVQHKGAGARLSPSLLVSFTSAALIAVAVARLVV